MKIEDLKPGMTVYDVGTYGMGNTVLRSVGVWPVRIIEVDMATRSVLASWNMNEPKRYKREIRRWRLKEPVLITNCMGQSRLATRAAVERLCK